MGSKGHEGEAVKELSKEGPDVRSVCRSKTFKQRAGKLLRRTPRSWNKNGRKKAETIRQSIQKVQFPNKRNSILCPKTQGECKPLRTEGPRAPGPASAWSLPSIQPMSVLQAKPAAVTDSAKTPQGAAIPGKRDREQTRAWSQRESGGSGGTRAPG